MKPTSRANVSMEKRPSMNPFKKTIKVDIRYDALVLYGLILITSILTLGLGTLSALSAAYKALFRRLKTEGDETNRVQTFISDMKKTLPESLVVWLFVLALGALGSFLVISSEVTTIIIGVILLIESLIIVFYGAAGLALFNYKRIIFVFKTALLMGHLHVLTTAKLFAGILFSAAFMYLLHPFIILITFPFVLFVSAHAFYPVFKIYITRIEADEALNSKEDSTN